MITTIEMNPKQLRDNTIAQDDDNDYDESGYIVFRGHGLIYFIARYSHCSCYDTFADLAGGGISDYFSDDETKPLTALWSGTREELLYLATNEMDPSMPDRKASPEDYDYDHLIACYREVLGKELP